MGRHWGVKLEVKVLRREEELMKLVSCCPQIVGAPPMHFLLLLHWALLKHDMRLEHALLLDR